MKCSRRYLMWKMDREVDNRAVPVSGPLFVIVLSVAPSPLEPGQAALKREFRSPSDKMAVVPSEKLICSYHFSPHDGAMRFAFIRMYTELIR